MSDGPTVPTRSAGTSEADSEAGRSNPDFVEALSRGLAVIQAFSADAPEMTLTEVATRTGLSPATARRSLLTLKQLGYVGSNGRRFLLRAKVLSLGATFLSSMNVRDVADAYLQDVAEAYRDATSLAVLEGTDVVYVAHVPHRRKAQYRVRVGSRRPVHATSLGHVLLAHQDPAVQEAFLARAPFPQCTERTTTAAEELRSVFRSVRSRGYALAQDQLEYGALALAVPIRDRQGRELAALNCSSDTSRVDADTLVGTRLTVLHEAATQIGEALARYPALVHSTLAEP